VLTDVGPVEVKVPRDVAGTFEPAIVRKRQRRLSGVDEMVLSLSAKGLTHGEISAHLAEVYGASVSKGTISTITDKVMDGMAEWSNRPLDRVYGMPWRQSRSDTGLSPKDRSGHGGSNGSTRAHNSSSTIHGRVPTPSRTAESSHR
jgi:hypothetical protein